MAQPPLLSRRGNLLADTSSSGLLGQALKPGTGRLPPLRGSIRYKVGSGVLSPKLRVLPFLLILLPLDLIVVVSLLIASAVGAMSMRMRSSIGKGKPALSAARATILILNWDGKHLLEECLPSVLRAVREPAPATRF